MREMPKQAPAAGLELAAPDVVDPGRGGGCGARGSHRLHRSRRGPGQCESDTTMTSSRSCRLRPRQGLRPAGRSQTPLHRTYLR